MSDLEMLRKRAKAAYKAKAFAEAVRLYGDLVGEPDPSDASAASDRQGYALALISAHRYEDAAIQLDRALAYTPDDARLHHKLGEVLNRLGRHAEAADALREAVRLEPKSAEHHIRLAIALRGMGREDDAQAEIRKTLDLEPDNTEAQIFQLEQNLLASPERDGQAEEAEIEQAREQPPAAPTPSEPGLLNPAFFVGVAQSTKIAYEPPAYLRPWLIVAEAVALLGLAIWARDQLG